MKLSDYTHGRDNNFNLIRIVAAYAVLITHSFALAIGTADAEPFQHALGMSIGTIAVHVFFITSGFLVSASLLKRQSTLDFFWARFLRIYPALFVMLLLTVVLLGSVFTTDPLPSYFTDSMTYKYFFKCLTLIAGVSHTLPGVFESNPYKNAVNGSLWTLPYELRMYAILAFLWIMLRVTPIHRLKVFKVTIVTCTLSAGFLIILIHIGYINSGILFLKLFFMFFCGASFYILKDRIVISQKILFIFVVALLIAIFDKKMFFFVYIISLAYIVFYIAYIPTGAIRHYNKLGDYSYGMYIYAFPVQQSIAALFPGVSVLSLIVISSVFTLLLAALSWNLIEKHALKFKGKYVTRTKSLYRKAKNRMSTKV